MKNTIRVDSDGTDATTVITTEHGEILNAVAVDLHLETGHYSTARLTLHMPLVHAEAKVREVMFFCPVCLEQQTHTCGEKKPAVVSTLEKHKYEGVVPDPCKVCGKNYGSPLHKMAPPVAVHYIPFITPGARLSRCDRCKKKISPEETYTDDPTIATCIP